jgi:methylmalonyl-CoA mutase cobalamin-binding subunit
MLMLSINKQGAGVLEQKLRERVKSAGFKDVELTVGGKA